MEPRRRPSTCAAAFHATGRRRRRLVMALGALAPREERSSRSRGDSPLLRTTRRRTGRDVSSWTVCGRRACRTSCGPRGDVGNNPCSRQAVVLVREALRAWRPRDPPSRHRRRRDAGWRRWRARPRRRARRMTGSSGAGGIGPRRCCARSVDARRSRCGGHRNARPRSRRSRGRWLRVRPCAARSALAERVRLRAGPVMRSVLTRQKWYLN
jgi:hypothetical protein